MREVITVSNSTDSPSGTALLHFRPTRSRIFRLDTAEAGWPFKYERVTETSFRVDFSPRHIDAGERANLFIEYDGEPLTLQATDWGETSVLLPPLSKPQALFALGLDFYQPELIAKHAHRLEAANAISDPDYRTASVFFAEYDHQTYPPLVNINSNISVDERRQRLFIVGKVADILRKRVLLRGRYFLNDSVPSTTEMLAVRFVTEDGQINEPTNLAEVQYLSNLQKAIFEKNYGTPINAEAIGEGFEVFTNGEIRFEQGVRNAEPDSAYEFSFAEFGFLALDLDVDKGFWGAVLPGLVRTQAIFMRVYKPHNKPLPRYVDWGSANFDEEKQVDTTFKQQLRNDYNSLTLDELRLAVGRHAAEAFVGDY